MSATPIPAGPLRAAPVDEGIPLQQALRPSRSSEVLACPKCVTPASPGARFCTECGGSLTPDCPACSAAVVSGDFCQACGHWLLEGQCRFCYGALAEGARFCEICGCNQSGLVCDRCQTTGFFDFCTACGDPVSEQGRMLAEQALENPEVEQALQSMRQLQAQLAELPGEEVKATLPLPPIASTGPSRLIPQEALQALREMGTAAGIQHDLDGQRAAQALAQSTRMTLSSQLRKTQREIEALIAATDGTTYPTPQAARRSLMQLRSLLAALGKVPSGWRCAAFGNVHDTPNDCANPSAGGTWIF